MGSRSRLVSAILGKPSSQTRTRRSIQRRVALLFDFGLPFPPWISWTFGRNIDSMIRVPCKECGASILEDTAARNGGLCAPCQNGTRRSLDAARIQREKEKIDPFHILFRRVRDHAAHYGFDTLSPPEATYYAVSALFSDLNRGAVQLFFDANSPEFRKLAMDGLAALARMDLMPLLEDAAKLCAEQDAWYATRQHEDEEPPHEDKLASITDEILRSSEDVFARLESFALNQSLVPQGSAP